MGNTGWCLGLLSLKKRCVVSSAEKCKRNVTQGTDRHWEEERHEFGFGHAELQILSFEDRKIKLRTEFEAEIRDLEIK